MQVYLVGGAVRDAVLGLPITDKDFMVVGATPQVLLDLGFIQVGVDFPVFYIPRHRQSMLWLALKENQVSAIPLFKYTPIQACVLKRISFDGI